MEKPARNFRTLAGLSPGLADVHEALPLSVKDVFR